MAPNKSSKKGGGKKGGGESKTGAAVRALDDDEEDKIQVTRVSLSLLFLCAALRRSTTKRDFRRR